MKAKRTVIEVIGIELFDGLAAATRADELVDIDVPVPEHVDTVDVLVTVERVNDVLA